MKRIELTLGKNKEKLPKGIKKTQYVKGINIYASPSLSKNQSLKRGLIKVNLPKNSYNKLMKTRSKIRKQIRNDLKAVGKMKKGIMKKLKGK